MDTVLASQARSDWQCAQCGYNTHNIYDMIEHLSDNHIDTKMIQLSSNRKDIIICTH